MRGLQSGNIATFKFLRTPHVFKFKKFSNLSRPPALFSSTVLVFLATSNMFLVPKTSPKNSSSNSACRPRRTAGRIPWAPLGSAARRTLRRRAPGAQPNWEVLARGVLSCDVFVGVSAFLCWECRFFFFGTIMGADGTSLLVLGQGSSKPFGARPSTSAMMMSGRGASEASGSEERNKHHLCWLHVTEERAAGKHAAASSGTICFQAK